MKKIFTLIAAILISINHFAQAPQKMSYQAVIRNVQNELVVNKPVKMRISILQGSTTGTSVYSELHSTATNANGLISIEIGGGTSQQGTFSSINWGNGTYFLKTETDPTNGSTYSIVGTSQLLSVPYALESNNAKNAGNGIKEVSKSGDTLYLDNGKKYIIPGIKDLNPSSTINNGLLAYYPFNGNANDESGNGNNGTVNGATLTSDRFGNTGKAYNFDGVNDYIQIPNSNSLNPSSVTICAWIKAERNNGVIVQKSNPTNATEFSYRVVYEDIFQGQRGLATAWGIGNCNTNSSNFYWSESGLIPQKKWVFIIITISSSGQSIQYYNGNQISSDTKSPYIPCNSTTSTLRIGGLHWQGDPEWFLGNIDDIRIYNRSLTQEEITYLANN